jgi:polyisoprenoid-binding protein YceI
MNAIALLALLIPPGETAGETTYWFGANEARTTITFESKTNVTNIVGKTTKVSGSATIDFDAAKGTCHLVVPADSLNSGMDDRDRAMHGRTWLDSKQFKTIEFKSEKSAKMDARKWKLDGQFSMRGVSQPVSIDVDVVQVPESLGKSLGEGQWIRVTTSFPVDITKHGIKIDQSAQFTVEPVWKVNITLFATTAKPADAPAAAKNPNDDEEGPRIVRVKPVSADGIPGKRFVMGKKPQLTTLVATSNTDIENITAQTSAIHGYVGIDAEKALGAVRLRVPAAQLKTGIALQEEQLRGPQWLDTAAHPDMLFESTKAVRKDAKTWTVEGNFTLRGVSKPLTVDIEVVDITAEEIKKANWGEKPGVRCSGEFKLKLSDFGLKIPEQVVAKVSDVVSVRIVILALLDE